MISRFTMLNGELINVGCVTNAWIEYGHNQRCQITLMYPHSVSNWLNGFDEGVKGLEAARAIMDKLVEANPALGRIGDEVVNVSYIAAAWVKEGEGGGAEVAATKLDGVTWSIHVDTEAAAQAVLLDLWAHAEGLQEDVTEGGEG